jgi:lipopolysaccharide transport system ATP-binding protein
MSKVVIQAEGLGKQYIKRRRSQSLWKDGFWAPLKRGYAALTGTTADAVSKKELFWAFRDVSFSVESGEALGIIGPNGAGKSTLLKVLARICPPTVGKAVIRGRVNSLLEVGTGFQKSLSGRDNIFLSAAVMGMSHAETKEVLDEIIEFSGVRDFIDVPVKYYSSGMYSRLAFSVAAHIRAEVLLVDEVLSVGDADFQRKSLGRMQHMIGHDRTVLFVSHDLDSVLKFCQKVLWLDKGKPVMYGDAVEVVREYMQSISRLTSGWHLQQNGEPRSLPEPKSSEEGIEFERDAAAAELVGARLLDVEGKQRDIFFRHEEILIELRYRTWRSDIPIIPSVHVQCSARHKVDEAVHVLSSWDPTLNRPRAVGDYVATVALPKHFLNNGEFCISVALVTPASPLIRHAKHDQILWLKIAERLDDSSVFGRKTRGVVRPLLRWQHEMATPATSIQEKPERA